MKEEIYKKYMVDRFCHFYNISKKEIIKNDLYYFRYTCFKYIHFIRHIQLPEIMVDSYYEAVMIEFRKFPHIEFLIRNAILKLGNKWSFTIICGYKNYDFIKTMCSKISPNIKIIKINQEKMSPSQYSDFLSSMYFWNLLHGEKIFLFQEDSIIFQNNIDRFLQFDYVGCPFLINNNDTPTTIGNGRFSLRTKSIMLQIINAIHISNTTFDSSILEYMKQTNSTTPPEDVYFYKSMKDLRIGLVADYNTAHFFCYESLYNKSSFGGQRFWRSNSQWKQLLKHMFNYMQYNINSNLDIYLNQLNLSPELSKVTTVPNAFDVDFFFCNNINQLHIKSKPEIVNYIKHTGMNGYIYHPKQVINMYPDILFYTFLNNIYIIHKNRIYTSHKFANKYLYNISYNQLHNELIVNKYYHLNNSVTLLLLVFIGNEERGIDLIHKIVRYKKIQPFNVSFCFNSKSAFTEKIKDIIQTNFTFYAIYESKEFGTDITPSLLMYESIIKKDHFEHIIKLQTKSITNQYEDLTNYLLSKPLNKLIENKMRQCNCIGHPNYYIPLKNDLFNKILQIEHSKELRNDYFFVGGTIFYCPSYVFDKTLSFMRQNHKKYLFNNLYENNSINQDYSPIHFLERVFGTIKI